VGAAAGRASDRSGGGFIGLFGGSFSGGPSEPANGLATHEPPDPSLIAMPIHQRLPALRKLDLPFKEAWARTSAFTSFNRALSFLRP
jgi:hypothetical protein